MHEQCMRQRTRSRWELYQMGPNPPLVEQEELELSSNSDTLNPNCPASVKRKKLGHPKIVVNSEVCRSPRIKGQKMGFKNPQCQDKSCLGCKASPPVFSSKTVGKLGYSLCGVDPQALFQILRCPRRWRPPMWGMVLLRQQPRMCRPMMVKMNPRRFELPPGRRWHVCYPAPATLSTPRLVLLLFCWGWTISVFSFLLQDIS